jgi:hypothetical protein
MGRMFHRLGLVKADVGFSDNKNNKEPQYHGEDWPNSITKLCTAVVVVWIDLVFAVIREFCWRGWSLCP